LSSMIVCPLCAKALQVKEANLFAEALQVEEAKQLKKEAKAKEKEAEHTVKNQLLEEMVKFYNTKKVY
jgi:uncharacterized Zn finger protein (UPF0148 family)